MKERNEHKFLIHADFYGIIASNARKSFWFPEDRGVLYFDDNSLCFRVRQEQEDKIKIHFKQIIRVKLISLNPLKNKWVASFISSPFYFLFWNPFWNRTILDITFFDEKGRPKELFMKLKTKKVAKTTLELLKKSMTYN